MNIGQIKVSAFEECGTILRKNKNMNKGVKYARKTSLASDVYPSMQTSKTVAKNKTSFFKGFVDYIKNHF